jgi:hypothetical protein
MVLTYIIWRNLIGTHFQLLFLVELVTRKWAYSVGPP